MESSVESVLIIYINDFAPSNKMVAMPIYRKKTSNLLPQNHESVAAESWNIALGTEINVKKIAFGNKEHTTDKKMGVSVLLRLFISSYKVCKTAYALERIHEQNSIFKDSTMIPKEMKYNLHYSKVY